MNNKQNKILHTRVPKDLYDKVSSKARKHRVTISNLVRNIVEDYLEIQGDVFDAIDGKIREKLDKKESVIGYQQITLEKNTICQICGEKIKKGEVAFVGFLENSASRIIACLKCKQTKG